MYRKDRFSERFNFDQVNQVEIKIRHEAPHKLRAILPILAKEVGLSPKPLRELVCQVLREAPDLNNWTDYPNITSEIDQLLQECQWYKIYDVIEEIYSELYRRANIELAEYFTSEINKFFYENGIGWKLENDQIEMRGSEAFEKMLKTATKTLEDSDRKTAKTEIHEALNDLSRRPIPDITGAIQHAMAALECLSRDVSNSKYTLGKLIQKNPDLFPNPLGDAIEKIWGYASNRGRHLLEDDNPTQEEAELIVGLVCTLATYLSKKFETES